MSHNLIEITEISHDVVLDIVYATKNNFMGQVIYKEPRCFLHKDMVPQLERSIDYCAQAGYKLKIFDGYRPMGAVQVFWDAVQDPRYVAHPKKGSMHSRGVALDVTLVEVKTDMQLDMGSGFDVFSDASHHFNCDVSAIAQRNRLMLLEIMLSAGWDKLSTEWWHYQAFNAESYPLISDDMLSSSMHLIADA